MKRIRQCVTKIVAIHTQAVSNQGREHRLSCKSLNLTANVRLKGLSYEMDVAFDDMYTVSFRPK